MKIKIVHEMPQWIISSDVAAYHPFSNTIYLKRGHIKHIFHELGHWFACKIKCDAIHKWLDQPKVSK